MDMYTSHSSKILAALLLVLVTCCLLSDPVTGSPVSLEKRGVRRITRARYRVGYMFGKRASAAPTSSALFDVVSRGALTKKELESLILRNLEVLNEVVTILDKDDDGYITASDLV